MKAFSPEEIKKAANVLRGLAIDEVQQANSGHPGMPMGMADVAATLALNHLRVSGAMPAWPDRDRLVFSGGHGSALLYALLHELGFGLSLDDLRGFRQLGTKTPGHPERGRTAGVEVSTGPLGQGFANAVGMALSQAMAAARFNAPGAELLAHWVWVLCGDGDLEEGISHEAASFAGALRIPRLVALYDSNGISIEGHVADAFRDDTPARFKAYGWRVLDCDGHDPASIDKALRRAKKLSLAGPVLVVCRTTIGFGSPNRAGTAKVHGEPLGPDEVKLTKKTLGLPEDKPFHDPEDVRALFETRAAAMKRLARKSERVRKAALAADPAKAALWDACAKKTVPADLYSPKPFGMELTEHISSRINRAVEDYRISTYNIEGLDQILKDVKANIHLYSYTVSDDGEEKISEAGVYSIVSMVLGIFLFKEMITVPQAICLALIIVGVVGLRLVTE